MSEGINFTNLAQIAHVALPKIKWKNCQVPSAKIRFLMALSLAGTIYLFTLGRESEIERVLTFIEANTNRKWIIDLLESTSMNDIFTTPQDLLFANHFLNWSSDFMVANKEAFRANSRVLTLLQVLMACGLVQQQSLNSNNGGNLQNIQSTQNVFLRLSLNFYSDIFSILIIRLMQTNTLFNGS